MHQYHIVADVEGTQKPRVMIRNNREGKMVFCLLDFNTIESEEGWTSQEIEELISTLKTGLEKSKHLNNDANTDFLFDSEWDT